MCENYGNILFLPYYYKTRVIRTTNITNLHKNITDMIMRRSNIAIIGFILMLLAYVQFFSVISTASHVSSANTEVTGVLN